MSAPAKCPGCGAKLEPDWENCPSCPLSFCDVPPKKGAFQNDSFRNFGLPIIFLAGFGLAIWTLGQHLWKAAVDGAKTVSVGKDVKAAAKRPAVSRAAPVSEEPADAGSVSIIPDAAPKRKAMVTEWKFRGAVYDLLTLMPVPGVKMIFTDNETNLRVEIQTDPRGRYRAILPPLAGRGYLVTLSKPDYEKTSLDPGVGGVSKMTLERRKEFAKELSTLIAEPASLEPRSEAPLVTDFHIAPK